MKKIILILCLFCALKISAQSVGGEIKHSNNTVTYKSAMASVVKQKTIYKKAKSKELDNASIDDDMYSAKLEEKAKQGNAAAQYALSKVYCFGNGIKADEERSKQYLVKSAEH